MLPRVPVQPKSIEQYRAIAGEEILEEIGALAEGLKGMRVLHINSTAHGGGVAEMLYGLVPLMNSVGLEADWRLLQGDQDFSTIARIMHNALQGIDVPFTDEMKMRYLNTNQENSADFEGEYDFVVVHDLQPCAIIAGLEGTHARRAKWIWRCHIDTTHACDEAWEFFESYINHYDAAIFTMGEFVKADLEVPLSFITPSIDPLSAKNIIPEERVQADIARRYNVDDGRPIMLQVSRLGPWKDPLALVDCYREVKEEYRGLQLVYLASMADDDPEGWHYYSKTYNYTNRDPDIHLLSNQQGIGNVEVSAFQAMAAVVLQKSLREGFGLTVTEALWKRKPLVAGAVGGIVLQVEDGHNGFLVDSMEDAAEKVALLLESSSLSQRMGDAGHHKVRNNFLITHSLRNYLRLFHSLL